MSKKTHCRESYMVSATAAGACSRQARNQTNRRRLAPHGGSAYFLRKQDPSSFHTLVWVGKIPCVQHHNLWPIYENKSKHTGRTAPRCYSECRMRSKTWSLPKPRNSYWISQFATFFITTRAETFTTTKLKLWAEKLTTDKTNGLFWRRNGALHTVNFRYRIGALK